jgi:excisionase family DNA binding protein
MDEHGEEEYLTPGEAARILHVSPKTISRWADRGFVPYVVTLGGHRRFPRRAVVAVAQQMRPTGNTSPD